MKQKEVDFPDYYYLFSYQQWLKMKRKMNRNIRDYNASSYAAVLIWRKKNV